MAGNITGNVMNWFTVNPEKSLDSAPAGTDIDVSDISAVAFNEQVNITFGAMTAAFELPAFTPIGIDYTVDTIQIDTACTMFAMGN